MTICITVSSWICMWHLNLYLSWLWFLWCWVPLYMKQNNLVWTKLPWCFHTWYAHIILPFLLFPEELFITSRDPIFTTPYSELSSPVWSLNSVATCLATFLVWKTTCRELITLKPYMDCSIGGLVTKNGTLICSWPQLLNKVPHYHQQVSHPHRFH